MKSFFKNKGPFDLNYLLNKIEYKNKVNFKKKKINNVSALLNAKKNELTFFDNMNYADLLKSTKASYCLINEKNLNLINQKKIIPIVTNNPLNDFITIAKLFYPESDTDFCNFKINKKYLKIKKTNNSFIGLNVTIGKKFKIGLNSVIKKNVNIGDNVSIGSNCIISNTNIGNNVIINDGTVIGKIGFGFKKIKNKLVFIPHFGYVDLEDNVYIGSCCTIDRGSFYKTIIKKNTMIDNQVHIAHNVTIGSNCYIAGQTGIAGSSVIGNNCLIGGKTGISGHLNIGDNVYIGGQSGVLKNIKSGSKVMGYPSTSIKNFIKRMKDD